jgi:endonuclease/exonuclease/phosphatase family metal-dependent hydrolase
MKLISLNTWGCRVAEAIFEYIRKNSDSTEIFCFQEILKGGNGKTDRGEIKSAYEDIAKLLPNHTGYFSEYEDCGYYGESFKNLDFKFGLACFARTDFKQSFVEATSLLDLDKKWKDYSGRFAMGTSFAIKVSDYVVINVHGIWQNSIKGDTEAKIEQSEKILDFTEKINGKKIICGDFNLLPDTRSIKILGEKYRNLVDEYKITDTRGTLYTKEFRYSDYIFVDKNISVESFSVSNVNVSDHLPLVLGFN